MSEETNNKVISRIAGFPTYISHYSRNETEANILSTDLRLNKMYSLYGEDKTSFNVGFSHINNFLLKFQFETQTPC